MWKRPDELGSTLPPTTPGDPQQPSVSPPPAPSRPATGGVAARLGPSLSFEGTLLGEEDLLVEGRFHGEIRVPQHQVTIGSSGQIEGEIRANAIIVEGQVRGNLNAAQQVLVRASGSVHGDIRAPRVALDQGCRFKGSIDMEPNQRAAEAAERREARRDEGRRDEPRREESRKERDREQKNGEAKNAAVTVTPIAS
jgi:cytoskeletal protein CcmA (bactofilin family)